MCHKDLKWRLAVNDEILQRLADDANSNSRNLLGSYFHFDFTRVIDEYAIAAVGQIERNTFICLVTRSPSISVPHTDGLTCKDRQASEPLILDNIRVASSIPFFTKAPNCSPIP